MASPRSLLHVFPSFVPGGAQVRTARLMEAFGDAYRHSVLSLDGRTDARELVAASVAASYLDAPPKAGSFATAHRLRSLLSSGGFDLVLTYNFGSIDTALAACTLPGVRLVHHEDGFGPDEAAGFKRRRVWLRRVALRRARRVVVISANLRRIATELWRLPEERVAYIPNGIDVDRFAPPDGRPGLRAELGIPADALVVGAVGHLRPEKNAFRLLEACRGRDVHVLLVGDGPDRERLEALAGTEGLAGRVTFAGYRPDPRELYRAMDVFALSSNTEQMPIALMEAMCSSLPVVTTEVGDAPHMLCEENRRFVVPLAGDAAAGLGAAIEALAADPELRASLGRANREVAERDFTVERMVDAFGGVYEDAMRG